MKQTTLAAAGFEKHGRSTRKAEFLSRMDALVPWSKFFALIETHYPKAGNGHSPVGLERMLCSRRQPRCSEAAVPCLPVALRH